jgi:hypothetical protein
VGYLAIAFTSPTATAPGNNVAIPLNTSITAQYKEGALVLGTNSSVTTALVIQYGKVGIGTTNPSEALDVAGSARFRESFILNPVNAPSSPAEGETYFNQNDKFIYYYNGSSWVRIGTATGDSCTTGSECGSGFCVDGYCCNSACSSTCYACNLAGHIGTCTAVTNYAEDTGCSGTCIGCSSGSCINIPAGYADYYGMGLCTNTHYRCNGSGSCTAPTNVADVAGELDTTSYQVCSNAGYDGCNHCTIMHYEPGAWNHMQNEDIDCSNSCAYIILPGTQYQTLLTGQIECYNWLYD